MAYDASKDPTRTPYTNKTRSQRLGRTGANIAVAGITPLNPYTRLLVTSDGTVSVLPVENADGAYVNLGTMTTGMIVPYEVREINGAGTTAGLASIGYSSVD
jgi:hypothetical protein